ncbi:hypothetical protein EV360DRAFT_83334 [Lentinula raphanica]|nr:hypothetical protein EV360DRAFT_83334 [Lentinula raphanica]
MNAASSKFRAGVVVQVLVLILVPLFPFCYAIPIPSGQAPGGPRAPSVPQSTSFESLVTPPDSYNSGLATPSSVRSPNDNDLATQTHPTGSSSSIRTPTRYIHHYIDFPDYPDDSDFLSLENVDPNPTNRSPTNAEKKVRQLIEVRKEVLNTLVTYIDKVDLEEVSNPQFTERFGHKFMSRIDSAPSRIRRQIFLGIGTFIPAIAANNLMQETPRACISNAPVSTFDRPFVYYNPHHPFGNPPDLSTTIPLVPPAASHKETTRAHISQTRDRRMVLFVVTFKSLHSLAQFFSLSGCGEHGYASESVSAEDLDADISDREHASRCMCSAETTRQERRSYLSGVYVLFLLMVIIINDSVYNRPREHAQNPHTSVIVHGLPLVPCAWVIRSDLAEYLSSILPGAMIRLVYMFQRTFFISAMEISVLYLILTSNSKQSSSVVQQTTTELSTHLQNASTQTKDIPGASSDSSSTTIIPLTENPELVLV